MVGLRCPDSGAVDGDTDEAMYAGEFALYPSDGSCALLTIWTMVGTVGGLLCLITLDVFGGLRPLLGLDGDGNVLDDRRSS